MNKKSQKGITLIALVVTIIVLLILAGTSIGILTGDNGIITKAQEAKELTEIAQYKEGILLIKVDLEIENRNKNLTQEEYMEEYKKKIEKDELFKGYQRLVRDNVQIDLITKEGYIFELSEEDEPLYKGKQGEPIKEMAININTTDLGNKNVILTANIENVLGREYNYYIFANGQEITTGITKRDNVTYNYETEFGTTAVYMKIEYEGKTIPSNTVTIEDNKIQNKAELEKFRDEVNAGNSYQGKKIEQIADIDLQGSSTSLWTPIASKSSLEDNSHPFEGTYDGGGHSILNIYIDTDQSFYGLFGNNRGIIENVGLKSGSIRLNGAASDLEFGAIAGVNSGTIRSCYNGVNIVGSGKAVGGICARNLRNSDTDTRGIVEKCYNSGDIRFEATARCGAAVGVVWWCDNASVLRCYNSGNITVTSSLDDARAVGILSGRCESFGFFLL